MASNGKSSFFGQRFMHVRPNLHYKFILPVAPNSKKKGKRTNKKREKSLKVAEFFFCASFFYDTKAEVEKS